MTYDQLKLRLGLKAYAPTYLVFSSSIGEEGDDDAGVVYYTLHYAGDYQREALREFRSAAAEGYNNVGLVYRG